MDAGEAGGLQRKWAHGGGGGASGGVALAGFAEGSLLSVRRQTGSQRGLLLISENPVERFPL